MNQRNVEALYTIVVELMTQYGGDERGLAYNVPALRRWWAEHLAARGVLVPCVLTDEEAYRVGSEYARKNEVNARWSRSGDNVSLETILREWLERIAKGEA